MFTLPEKYYILSTDYSPNNRLPVLIYRNVLPKPHDEACTKEFLERNGWERRGTWGAILAKHFHPNTHECYGVFQGKSELIFGAGGADSEEVGVRCCVQTGDVIVVPAGVSHASASADDKMVSADQQYRYVGVYPQEAPKWRNEYGKRLLGKNDSLFEEIAAVPIPRQDPVYGVDGPLVQIWDAVVAYPGQSSTRLTAMHPIPAPDLGYLSRAGSLHVAMTGNPTTIRNREKSLVVNSLSPKTYQELILFTVLTMLNYFGLNKQDSRQVQTPPAEEQQRALPASWYRSAAMYELERRAIFSRKWILLTHSLRFQKPGDYVAFTEAGFSFFLVMDRDRNINGFHNICRHRAFPIVTQDSGSASILSCRYHGWSYGYKGNLAKAPRFDTVPDFDKAEHALLPISVHVDAKGFIWVNLQAGKPTIAWEDDFEGVDTQPRLSHFDLIRDYRYDHSWSMQGDYNWKTLADNYNECYHCATGHPGVNAVADLSVYRVETKGGHIQHWNRNKDESDTTMIVCSSFLFPNSCFTITPDFFYMMRCIPVSSGKTKMEYDVFRRNDTTDENFARINDFYKQVLQEDKDLCNGAQKNLEGGIFINGQLHPEKEKGPLFFQKTVRDLVMAHRAHEESVGHDVWPASPQPSQAMKTGRFMEEDAFCMKLDAGACDGPSEQLSW
ncbi:hypothetical protein JX265_006775 [Neoarthrinium moseri]|uniref:Choline monooxygenase, chloroplastic n=1 Tax=Neoarthrinium moseri TaxID=1658444 RepID=A0A9P9WLB6_9PEZI|nr:hypothetical protein JX265_006775 [Neoarthrinium moseri]